MKRIRKENAALYAFITENWKHKTDFQMSQDFDDNTAQNKVKHIRIRLGFIRDKDMLERMYAAHRAGSVNIGRGTNNPNYIRRVKKVI